MVCVTGVDEALTFKPPVGPRSIELLWLMDQSDQVWLSDAVEDVVARTVLLVVVDVSVPDQSDHVVLLAEDVVEGVVLPTGVVEAEVVVLVVVLPRSGVVEPCGVVLPISGVVVPCTVVVVVVTILPDVVVVLDVSGP